MRAQIAGEKLPLAQELTTLEESVIQLRRDNEKVQRLVDAGALEIGTMKAEMKVRQDELSYIGSLLDEYARTFETKVGVGEMQIYGEPVETAKQAVENKTLTPTERFARQTLFTSLTIKRLFDVIGGNLFAGVGVDTLGTVMNGQFAMIGPITFFVLILEWLESLFRKSVRPTHSCDLSKENSQAQSDLWSHREKEHFHSIHLAVALSKLSSRKQTSFIFS